MSNREEAFQDYLSNPQSFSADLFGQYQKLAVSLQNFRSIPDEFAKALAEVIAFFKDTARIQDQFDIDHKIRQTLAEFEEKYISLQNATLVLQEAANLKGEPFIMILLKRQRLRRISRIIMRITSL